MKPSKATRRRRKPKSKDLMTSNPTNQLYFVCVLYRITELNHKIEMMGNKETLVLTNPKDTILNLQVKSITLLDTEEASQFKKIFFRVHLLN